MQSINQLARTAVNMEMMAYCSLVILKQWFVMLLASLWYHSFSVETHRLISLLD